MKHGFYLVLLLVLWSGVALAQSHAIDKGARIISGTASFSSYGGKLYKDNGDRATFLQIEPSYFQFIVPNVTLGGTASFQRQSESNFSKSTLSLGPAVGYFIGDANSKNYAYFSVGIRYQSQNQGYGSSDYTLSGKDIVLSFGLLAPIKKHIGLTAEISYHTISMKNDSWDDSESGDMFMIGFGIAGLLF